MKKIILILIILLTSFLLFGCINQIENDELKENGETKENGEKLEVMASFYPFYDIAKNIAQDKANVSVLVPPASEPHSFNPSPQDILRVSRANIFIVTGTEFEEWEERIVNNVNPNAVVVKANEGITLLLAEFEHSHSHDHTHEHNEHEHTHDEHNEHNEHEHTHDEHNEHNEHEHTHDEHNEHNEHEHTHDEHKHSDHGHSHGLYDPHFWISPKNVIEITNTITNALAKADPKNASYYIANANEFKQQVQQLHNEFERGLSNCEKSEIITTHAAFAYLGNDYGFEQIPIFGLSPENEPTPSQIIKLIEESRHHGIKHIFYEELVDPRVAQTIANEVGAEVLVLHNIEGSIDGKGYIELMTQNLSNLRTALVCE